VLSSSLAFLLTVAEGQSISQLPTFSKTNLLSYMILIQIGIDFDPVFLIRLGHMLSERESSFLDNSLGSRILGKYGGSEVFNSIWCSAHYI
jgi:hypothetical protein